jgi:hypothetical protein
MVSLKYVNPCNNLGNVFYWVKVPLNPLYPVYFRWFNPKNLSGFEVPNKRLKTLIRKKYVIVDQKSFSSPE